MEKENTETKKNPPKGRFFSFAGVVLLVLLLVFIGLSFSSANNKSPVVLTYAEMNPVDGTICGEMAKAFKEKTEELTGGSVVIDIQASGVLGSEEQLLDNLMGGGTITDILRISSLEMTKYGCKKVGLLAIPYTFVDEDHFWKFAASDAGEEILREPEEIGLPVRGLCFGEEGFRHFFTCKKVENLEGFKGMKLRVSADPISTDMVSELNAAATMVPFTELYTALSTGVVDGAEQPLANYFSNAFYEVAPYLITDGHTLGAMEIIISQHAWDKLSDEQQEQVMEAADYASEACGKAEREVVAQAYKDLEAKGVEIVDVKDKTPWVNSCQEMIEKYSRDEADLYKKIVDLK